jgi:DNA-binding response OmpR family regulator
MPAHETILLVEDQRDLRELVQRCLEHEGFDVIGTGDGAYGLQIAKQHRPDLLILDLTLPGMDGLEVCKALRRDAHAGRTPVIVLSARGSEDDRLLGFEYGADDYLGKPFSPRELLARVRAVLRRTNSQPNGVGGGDSAIHRVGDLELNHLNHEILFRGRALSLRLSEFRVLAFLASAPGRAFSRDEIIDGALERDISTTERTIDVHINKIRQQLGEDGTPIIETVRGVGYRLRNS